MPASDHPSSPTPSNANRRLGCIHPCSCSIERPPAFPLVRPGRRPRRSVNNWFVSAERRSCTLSPAIAMATSLRPTPLQTLYHQPMPFKLS